MKWGLLKVLLFGLAVFGGPMALAGCGDTEIIAGSILGIPVEGDIIAYDMESQEMFYGTTTTIPGTLKATIFMKPFSVGSKKCRGQALITALASGGSGSLGEARLICNDGSIINAEFTYESYSSGFGVGADTSGHLYRFMFGYDAPEIRVARELLEEKFREIELEPEPEKEERLGT